jgi:hypothetical protein
METVSNYKILERMGWLYKHEVSFSLKANAVTKSVFILNPPIEQLN